MTIAQVPGRDEGREVMKGCHQEKGARRSLSVKSKWDGEGVIIREFSCKRWRRRSYKRSKERVSNRDCVKKRSGSDFVRVVTILSA